MTTLVKKFWFFAMVLAMAFFAACSADGPVQVITPKGDILSEDEYAELVEKGEIDEQGNVIVKDTTAKSSSSKKVSSSSAKSSSSSSGKVSSSSEKATSSSSEKVDSSADAESSSSEKVESSSSEPESSSAELGKETVANTEEGDFSFGTDDMEEVSASAQSELDSLKEILDNGGTVDGFEKTEMEFNEETLPVEIFDEQDFFCFTGEGEWLQITKEMLGQYIPHYKNDHAWGNLRHFDVKFMDACSSVYIRRK